MSRRGVIVAVLAAALAFAGAAAVLMAVAPDAAPRETLSAVAAPGQRAGVDDFRFAQFDARYQLGRDDDGRSTLRTTEHLVAVFPETDQNRGIRRAIPAVFDGHETHPEIVAVMDSDGIPRHYTRERDGDFLVLTIAVPAGQYVHGEQHYVIEYTLRDVTRHFGDTNADEFYWDVNGDGWAQPFDQVTARLEPAPELLASHTSVATCFRGLHGSKSACPITRDGDRFFAEAEKLRPQESVTVALAFEPGTFTPVPFDLFAVVSSLQLVGLALIGGTLVAAVYYRLLVMRRPEGHGTVVAWYEPPEGMTLPIAANLLKAPKRAFTATLLDLAVRGRVRIVTDESGDFGVRLIDRDGLPYEEAHLISRLFWSGTSASEVSKGLVKPDLHTRWFVEKEHSLGFIAASVRKNADRLVLERGLRRTVPVWPAWLVALGFIAGITLLIVQAVQSDDELLAIVTLLGALLTICVGIVCVSLVAGARPFTREGALLVEHLEGLRVYIRLAEADRLRMLQGVSGADRVPASDGKVDVVKVHERLLPYAVLFKLEREWQAELAKFYDETAPTWTDGSISVSATSLISLSSFTSHLASLPGVTSSSSSWGTSGGSSSSGGTGGGGYAGGGGGGGGGGGV